MKSKVITTLILCIFLAPGIAISQTIITDTKVDRSTREAYQKSIDEYRMNMDSIIAPSLRTAGEALNRVWSRSGNDYFQILDNSRNSSLSFRKEFKEKKNINRSYEMEFTKESKAMSIHISAEAREGKIQIVIIKPNGKNFKVLEVEDLESLNWDHTLNAYTEENKKEYEGTWQVKVSVQNAIGYYSIKLNMR